MTRSTFPQSKITPVHLRRQALIYSRQSSTPQVRSPQESTERQDALVQRAAALGWPPETIDTLDEDQGRSGTSAVHRPGFKKLWAEISAGQGGLGLALEASRLARSAADWHRLVEICRVTRTFLADDGAVYDPREPNDRLWLGVQGTLSAAELFTRRCRLQEGRWQKARRGALMRSLPVGYVLRADGTIGQDPDRQVQARLAYVFRLFTRLRVARTVLVQLRTEDLQRPTQVWGGPQHGRVVWKAPTLSALVRLRHNPTYAGVYVYGQCAYDPLARSATTGKANTQLRPLEEWPVCLQAAFPAYLAWDQFVEPQRVLRANWYRADRRGAPRKGAALLQGGVFCGRWGHTMRLPHYATRETRAPASTCYHAYHAAGGPSGQCRSAQGVDAAGTGRFLQAVSPAKVDIALRALQELEHERAAARAQWALHLQQADYEVQLAQRRYETVDPANRLVAGEREAPWEAALQHRELLTRRFRESAYQQERESGPKEGALLQDLAADMERVWSAHTTTREDRKTLLRSWGKRGHREGGTEPGRIRIEVEWHTGAPTSTTIERPVVGAWAPRTPVAVEQRIGALLPTHTQTQIAHSLNAEGFRSAKGKAFDYRTVRYIIQSRGWQVPQKAQPTGCM